MKTARTIDRNANAPYFDIHDYLPRRQDTILAAVLVWLFEGGRPLTAWDGVDAFRTLHLDAAIRTLKKKYRWAIIETVTLPMHRADGTIFYVTGYKLPQVVIDYAYRNLGVQLWIRKVKVAQGRKRIRDIAKAVALGAYRQGTGQPSFLPLDQYLYRR